MSRSGYSDDYDDNYPLALYRGAVKRATTGYRGQHLLRRLRDALDAMPVKRLITDAIKDTAGDVCALGALDAAAPAYDPEEYDGSHAVVLANYFGVATALAAEIVYMNDEFLERRGTEETPEQRWTRMRAWVETQIVPTETPSED